MEEVVEAIRAGRLFGMALVDISVPQELRQEFAEFPPIFKNVEVGREDMGDFMREYCERNGLMKKPVKQMISSFWAKEVFIITPMIKWYLEKGLVVSRVHLVAEWDSKKCFEKMMLDVADARRDAQRDPGLEALGSTSKLLANSAYGKFLTDKSKHRNVKYLSGRKLNKAIDSKYFCTMEKLSYYNPECVAMPARRQPDLEVEDMLIAREMVPDPIEEDDEEEDQVYEVSSMPKKNVQDLPIQIASFVYGYAKVRMLEFVYDFMRVYLDPKKWEILYTDTDSLYFATSSEDFDDLLLEEKKTEFYRIRHHWFPSECCDVHRVKYVEAMVSGDGWTTPPYCCKARKLYDQRTMGLFKTEFEGLGMVALCSKTYFCKGFEGREDKCSSKGLQKSNNNLSYEQYAKVLETGRTASGTNKGIRCTSSGHVYTYEQDRAALSYLYCKRKVLGDGVTTVPLDL